MSHNINKNRDFLLVAITGGIASGKSTVADQLRATDVTLIDADLLAKKAVNDNPEVLKTIVDTFGEQILDSDGRLNRALMAKIIFSDTLAKRKLEGIIHPEVQNLFQNELQNLPESTKIVLYLVPLLVEAKIDLTRFDLIVSVLTEPEITLQRILTRDGISEELALKKIKSQASNQEKLVIADYVIYNNGTISELRESIRIFRIYLDELLKANNLGDQKVEL